MIKTDLFHKIQESKLSYAESIDILREVVSSGQTAQMHQKLFIALQFKDNLHLGAQDILDGILHSEGLYPYCEINSTSLPEALRIALFKSERLPFIYHREQFKALLYLENKKSLVLSAPTSFGKSLLIEEVVVSRRYKNIVVLQPTLALIDETRKKLRQYSDYKLIFNKSQKPSDKNIFLLTQERVVDFENLPKIDFFVIDEFYKLSLEVGDRRSTLNHAFYKLFKSTKQFFLLGPMVDVAKSFETLPNCLIMHSSFRTVSNSFVTGESRTLENLVTWLNRLGGQSLIYVSSPQTAEDLAKELIEPVGEKGPQHREFIDWAKGNIHSEWGLLKLLEHGIAFHHAQMPRYAGNYVVDAFNRGHIRFLVCTSTLMEGVNTSAKNVLVYDLKKGVKKLDQLDMQNISGRAGRMKKHFVGNVVIFGTPKPTATPSINIDWIDQDSATEELLIQLDNEHLTPSSLNRLQIKLTDTPIPPELLKNNSGISIDGQISLAREISENIDRLHPLLYWNGYPTGDQLKVACDLIFRHLIKRGDQRIKTGKQLAFFIDLYRANGSAKSIIDFLIANNELTDIAIRETFGRIRTWFEFRFPKNLVTLSNIQEHIFAQRGKPSGDYKYFAGMVENNFLPQEISALREIGVPLETINRLMKRLVLDTDSDSILQQLKRLALDGELHPYEVSLIKTL